MKTWSARVRRRLIMLRQLSTPSEWGLFLRVLAFAALVPLLFHLRLPLLSRLLSRPIPPNVDPRLCADKTEQIIRCVNLARAIGRPLVNERCLTRAVTLYYFLRGAGLELTLCFGAACANGRLIQTAGHCWLMKDGVPFLEPRNPVCNFVPIYWLPHPNNLSDTPPEA